MMVKKQIVYSFDLAVFLFIAIILFSKLVTVSLSHDEQQFVAPAELLVSHGWLPYADYPYLHTPYMVFINILPVLLPFPHFFAIRIFNAVFLLLGAIILYFETIKIIQQQNVLGTRLLATTVIFIYMFNPVMGSSNGWALNHAAPMLFSLIALCWFLDVKRRQNISTLQTWVIATGVLISISAFTRLTYAALLPVFLIGFIVFPAQSMRNRFYATANFLGGIVIGALPALYLFFRAPWHFFYGNFVYIRLNTLYQSALSFNNTLSLSAKISYFLSDVFLAPSGLLLYAASCVCLLAGIRYFFRQKDAQHFSLLFISICCITMLITAFAPTPIWSKYFLAPLPFMAICLSHLVNQITKNLKSQMPLYGISILLLLTIASPLYRTAAGLSILNEPANWTPLQIHNLAEQIKERLKTSTAGGKVLTLGPVLPLDAGTDVFEIFAVGPFSWRTSLLLSPEYRQRYGVVSPDELQNYLKNTPPTAILTGIEADFAGFEKSEYGGLENPFIEYAQTHHYRAIRLPLFSNITTNQLILWVP